MNPAYEKLFSFSDATAGVLYMGRNPHGDMVQGVDGNLYGTTLKGGANGRGTVYKLSSGGVLTTLVEFTGSAGSSKGQYPWCRLVQASDWNFYGTTNMGGASNKGTVFKLTPGGVLTTLVEFTGTAGSYKGSSPQGGLVQGFDGNLYGMTTSGGANNMGTVYKLTPGGGLTTLVEFTGTTGNSKGSSPDAGLVQFFDGTFYGTTSYGGASNKGTVFKLTPGGVLTTLVEFSGTSGSNKGDDPSVDLVLGNDGNFYGTTSMGGASNKGTVFKLTPGGVLTTLVEFTGTAGSNRGQYPEASLVQCSDGNFYGTTYYGGLSDMGTVFKLTPGGVLTTLAEFTDTPSGMIGRNPWAGLVQRSDGNLYGTTTFGGANNTGTVFKLTPGGQVTTLVGFVDTESGVIGNKPWASLVQGRDGNFYGTTTLTGGSGFGTVFKLTPAGVLTTLIEFTGVDGSNKGANPYAGLVLGSDGNFYGTTIYGGLLDMGTVFKLTPDGVLTTLVEFTGTSGNKGAFPYADLVQGSDGNFYGTTASSDGDLYGMITSGGGSYKYKGTVFKLTPDGELTTLVEFTGTEGSNKGRMPYARLLQAGDGNFYGTTFWGGASDLGTVFRLTPGGVLTTLVEFTGNTGNAPGSYPRAGLVQGSDGNFYGTTKEGGASGDGTVFRLTPGGVLTTLIEFNNTMDSKGMLPNAGLVQGGDGNWYGTTSFGGASDLGTVFKLTPGGVLTTLHDFTGDLTDSRPNTALVAGFDGDLYGTTYGADGNGFGSIYRMVFPGMPTVFHLPPDGLTTTHVTLQCKVNPRGAATMVMLEYGNDGISFPHAVPVRLSLTGYQTTWVGGTLGDLTPGTTYFYRFRSTNSAGETLSPVQSIATLAEPAVAIAPASDILPASARFNGTVNTRNFEASVVFEWGTDGNNFPNTVVAASSIVTGNSSVPVSVSVAGLVRGTTYYYRVVAANIAGTGVSGTQSFTTLTEPLAVLGGASAISTTRARVEGTADAKGSVATVSFEYGTDGANFPNSLAAGPASVGGGGPVAVSAVLTGLTQGTTYYYRIRAVGQGGTGLSGTGTFSLSILSGLAQVFPDPPPPGSGTVTLNFDPPSRGAWRFAGERGWRNSGVTVDHLASGQRLIEFLPMPGYICPPMETLEVTHGVNLTLDRVYFETMVEENGGLIVRLKPAELAAVAVPVASRAQWHFVGETLWRNSGGASLTGLRVGSYLVECKPVAGRVTPPIATISIANGESRELTLTYFTANNPGGAAPLPLDYGSVATNEDLPFAFVGQIRSEVGSSTGFVVKRRVVATAGHVVFDDGTLNFITGLQWLFQQHSGEYEPQPQVPRGSYLAAGYAAQRIADASPGEGSPQSQNLDFAALYFLEEAGRGGYGGFLATDAGDGNEFLDSAAAKILAGYATDGVPVADQGRLHATAAFTAALTPAYGETWTSTAVRGLGGCSGGPLFVQSSNGSYAPAAIYLGGAGQTVVRAINSEVVELFNRAEVSGNGGDNNTGGGITHTSLTAIGSNTLPGALQYVIEPAAARFAGAGWRLKPETAYLPSGTQKTGLNPGSYTVEFRPVKGFQAPSPVEVTVNKGTLAAHVFEYVPADANNPISWSDPAAITYGTPLSATQLNATASLPGKLSYSPALGSKLFAGQQTLTVTFTPADADHNPVAHKSVTLTVNPAVAKITIGSLKQSHTGQPKPVTVTTVPPGLKVDLSYASATYPASASAPVNVGSYGVTATVNDPNGTGVKSGTLVINKGRQTITFPTLPTLHNGDPDYILPPYSSSGLAISYKSSALAVATIVDGNTLHIVGAGKVTLTASAPATANWLPAGVVSKTLTIGKRSQTIAFAAFSGHTVGEADFSPGATATSGLTVTYASASPAVATIMAGKIHLVGKGTVVITASQAGNTRWDVAAPIKQSLTVAGKPQTITFPTLADKGYGTADFAPGASASSALAVTYASSNPLVATIVSGRIHITGVGTTTVTAKQAGSALWAAADDATQTFTVIKGTPVITWAAPQAITYGTALTATQLNAKANVRGTLFVYDPALGSKLDAGIQTLRVTFTPADATRYNTALTSVPWVVNKGNQTISFASLPAVRAGDADVALTAKASSGLGVSFVSAAPAVATIVDGKIHVVGVGSTIVTASQPGDTNWNAALPAKQILTVKATAGTSLAALTVQAGDPEIRAFYAAMKNRIDAHDQDGVFALFAPDYLHQGRNLSDQFDDEPGLFDAVRTFAFDITGITVTGDHAVVSGVATFTSDTGAAAEIWAEPDTSDLSPGIGWLKMTPDGWRVSGDRQRAKVGAQAVHDATAGKESYTLELTADSSLAITSVSVSGPGIPDTALVPDPDNGGFTADIDGVLDPMPAEGSKYAFLIEFADGTRETYHDTVKSWEQPAPATTAHPSGEPEMVK